jgi:hypothetical protein
MANFHIYLRPAKAAEYYLYAVSRAFIPGAIDFLFFGRIPRDESSDAFMMAIITDSKEPTHPAPPAPLAPNGSVLVGTGDGRDLCLRWAPAFADVTREPRRCRKIW